MKKTASSAAFLSMLKTFYVVFKKNMKIGCEILFGMDANKKGQAVSNASKLD